MTWCDWRFNTDIKIRCWNYSKDGDEGEINGITMGFVDYTNKELFLGTPYLYDFDSKGISCYDYYQDMEYLVNIITHEMIHLILAAKIDAYERWFDKENGDGYFATHGWDRVCRKVGL